VAANLITLIIGLQLAIFINRLLPITAVIDAREDGKKLGKLLIASTTDSNLKRNTLNKTAKVQCGHHQYSPISMILY
jgi:hypothetical protein